MVNTCFQVVQVGFLFRLCLSTRFFFKLKLDQIRLCQIKFQWIYSQIIMSIIQALNLRGVANLPMFPAHQNLPLHQSCQLANNSTLQGTLRTRGNNIQIIDAYLVIVFKILLFYNSIKINVNQASHSCGIQLLRFQSF